MADERHTQCKSNLALITFERPLTALRHIALEDYYRQRQTGAGQVPGTAFAKKEEIDADDARGLQVASGVSSAKRSRSPSIGLGGDAGESSKRWRGEDEGGASAGLEEPADEEGGGAQVVTGESSLGLPYKYNADSQHHRSCRCREGV